MKCPVDGTDLLMTTREGVEIDYCPKCRGIWLDRGELDKLIERAMRVEQSARAALDSDAPKAKRDQQYDDRRPQQPYDDRRPQNYDDRRPQQSSPLEDMFEGDFGDSRRSQQQAPRRDYDDDYYDRDKQHGKPQKKRGFLGEIFDIFD
ncbi:MAG: zf-TFIIB domain-containing protein [Anaerolineae bacterium]|jgi:hypothetical protein|nr:zf-TFIIB domain-containing protein [Anaerolineae bacterium]